MDEATAITSTRDNTGELDEFAFSPVPDEEEKSEAVPMLGFIACR